MATKGTKATSNKKGSSAGQKAEGAAAAIDAKLSGPLAPLEKALDGVFGAKAPYQLPKNWRETLVSIAPWLSLIGGIFGLLASLGLWRAAHQVNELTDYANRLSVSVGGPAVSNQLGIFFWLSLVAIVIFALLALLAFPGLKARKKTGWNLMFYSAIANFLYAVISLFYDGAGFGTFFGAALGTVIGLYLLFQIRSYYK